MGKLDGLNGPGSAPGAGGAGTGAEVGTGAGATSGSATSGTPIMPTDGMLTTFGSVGWSGGVGLNRRSIVGSIGIRLRGIVPKFIDTRSTIVCDTISSPTTPM
jgi:hypothetical protein